MKSWRSIGPLLLLLPFGGCAETRPVYFGADARSIHENGADYWEGAAQAPSYLQVRMRRRRQAPELDATVYTGTLSLHSIAAAVMRSTFTMTEGASASFHYDFNVNVARELAQSGRTSSYFPDALDVVVVCAQGTCGADSKPLEISPQGTVELRSMPILIEMRAPPSSSGSVKAAAAESLAKDNECAILHDSLKSLRERDASIRSFIARYGDAETGAMAKRVRRNYTRKGCAAWLEERGGVGAAWRRVRVSQWMTSRN
jgi:hypothetical protein